MGCKEEGAADISAIVEIGKYFLDKIKLGYMMQYWLDKLICVLFLIKNLV